MGARHGSLRQLGDGPPCGGRGGLYCRCTLSSHDCGPPYERIPPHHMALFRSKPRTPRGTTPPRSASAASVGSANGQTGPADQIRPSAKSDDFSALEPSVQRLGEEILAAARSTKSGILSKAFWSDKLMDWTMRDESFKVQFFRFVDAFPTLRTSEQIHDHLSDYMSQPGVTPPPGFSMGMKAGGLGGLAKGLMARTISSQITSMAQKFIAGTDAASALPDLKKLWQRGMAFSVDLLGEACVSDEEAIAYQRKYLDLIENLPKEVARWESNETLEADYLGPIPRTNVSIKISSLHARTDPIDTEGSLRGLMKVLLPILEAAASRGVLINFDMEQFALKDLTLELFMRCCEQIDFPAGLAMQAYLRSGDDDARRIIEWAKARRRQVTVRLVKGAYWDYETIFAEQMGWPPPTWGRKSQTDACFERMTRMFIENLPRCPDEGGVKLALGSHNVRSIAVGLALLEQQGLPARALELQMLHGMADQLRDAASERGLRVREYVPVGEMIPGMAYLVRRLLENTSNESWLKAGFLDNAAPEQLLASPHERSSGAGVPPVSHRQSARATTHELSPAVPGVGDGLPFFSEPMRNFADPQQREEFGRAVNAAV